MSTWKHLLLYFAEIFVIAYQVSALVPTPTHLPGLIIGCAVGGTVLLVGAVVAVVAYRRYVKHEEDADAVNEAKAKKKKGEGVIALLPNGRMGSVIQTTHGPVLVNVHTPEVREQNIMHVHRN
jgi:membrane protein implicated in regulation of membrane protease activity